VLNRGLSTREPKEQARRFAKLVGESFTVRLTCWLGWTATSALPALLTSRREGEDMQEKILRLPAVKFRTGLSRSTIYARAAEGAFPKPIALGARAVGWIESEIDQWLTKQIKRSRKAASK
jgi:prophage regulatory protein